jgi:hypothetical protein
VNRPSDRQCLESDSNRSRQLSTVLILRAILSLKGVLRPVRRTAPSGATFSRGAPARAVCRRIAQGVCRNRRFAIIRDAAWITLYGGEAPISASGRVPPLRRPCRRGILDAGRSRSSGDRATAPGGDRSGRDDGASHHPGMAAIAAILAAPLPWNDSAAEQHVAWLLGIGVVWWDSFASLAGGAQMENAAPARRESHLSAKAGLGEWSGEAKRMNG